MTNMKRTGWFIPIAILAANLLAIAVQWNSLSEILPAHFDLEGNAAGTMLRSTLLLYPLIGAAVCFAGYLFALYKRKYQMSMIILVSGISLILLMSTMVTLTSGTMPVFMLAEPVILFFSIVACVICAVKSNNKQL